MCARSAKTRPRSRSRQKTIWSQIRIPMTVIAGGLAVAGLIGLLAPPAPVGNHGLPLWLPLCPVGAFPVNFIQRLETTDGAIFFCCPRCIEKYKAAPEEYRKAVKAQGAVLAKLPKVQVACPVSGDVPDRSFSHATKAGEISFCSAECAAEFEQHGDVLFSLASVFTFQKTCPVTGRPIDPRWATPVNENVSVYFCSAECVHRYRQSPSRYQKALATQGFRGRF